MAKIQQLLLLTFLVIIAGCNEPEPNSPPVIALPTAKVTLTPAHPPTTVNVPPPPVTATLTPSPVPTATPATTGRWQCDPSGGLACYESLYKVAMLNAEEAWTAGLQGMLLHFTRQPGSDAPTWQYVKPLNTGTFNALFPLRVCEFIQCPCSSH